MPYIDGFVAPVPAGKRDAYIELAAKSAPVFQEHGALQVVETFGTDVPHGKQTDFYRAVAADEGDTIVFSWIVWPDKATRDAGWEKVMADPSMAPGEDMPFDPKRMIYGEFEVVLDTGA
ncbi:DUF1428 domain-containing protein [Sphingomonas hengshuiensis]|uniref:DUF1428 domain-containing protein n=1 Tax=Sphingomonas hengshuiensis TaxID=1609977 RepID=A0A7U5BEE8_9SPHN|nr:DUF1428 domain-containing protein [Sphingomonas hengshuiensis]AJP70737.1 hypothetical protein TS85_01200 [Sphingomonas hengshuiensis]